MCKIFSETCLLLNFLSHVYKLKIMMKTRLDPVPIKPKLTLLLLIWYEIEEA